MRHSTGGIYNLSITKLFNKWLQFSLFIYNISFYELKPIVFGTPFFKKEVNSINWLTLPKFNTYWRYTKLFLFFTPLHFSNKNNTLFKVLRGSGVYNSVVLDINYHRTTIVYLHKFFIFTLGIVPTSYDLKSVDLGLPVATDNIFTQLFFIKFFIKTSKVVEYNKFLHLKDFWFKNLTHNK